MSGIINSVGSKSGIVGSDVYPTGHIVQCLHATNDTIYSSQTLSEVTCTNWNGSITKTLGANSKIIGIAGYTAQVYQGATSLAAWIQIWFTRTAPSDADFGFARHHIRTEDDGVDQLNAYSGGCITFEDTLTTNGVYTYVGSIKGGNTSGVPAVGYLRGDLGRSSLILMEVVV